MIDIGPLRSRQKHSKECYSSEKSWDRLGFPQAGWAASRAYRATGLLLKLAGLLLGLAGLLFRLAGLLPGISIGPTIVVKSLRTALPAHGKLCTYLLFSHVVSTNEMGARS